MLDDLVSVIETLQRRIHDHGPTLRENETRTRLALIDPLLTALGWDVSDPSLVTPEYNVSGRWADYALLRPDGQPAATVEAKKLGESLGPHRMQMLNYSNASGVEYAGLTDGDHWELYEVFQRRQLEDRRILDIRIGDTPVHECALQLLLLWRPNLATGQPVKANPPVLGRTTESEPTEPMPVRPDPLPEPDPESGWVALSSYQTGAGMPNAIRLPDGIEHGMGKWVDLPVRIASWLWATGNLNRNNVPVSPGGNAKRYIVSLEPIHSDGKPFNTSLKTPPPPIPETPLHFERNYSGDNHVKHAVILLRHCGLNPATVQLQVEQ